MISCAVVPSADTRASIAARNSRVAVCGHDVGGSETHRRPATAGLQRGDVVDGLALVRRSFDIGVDDRLAARGAYDAAGIY